MDGVAVSGGRLKPLRPLIDFGDGTLGVRLTGGYVAFIDAEDRQIAEPWNWTAYTDPRHRETYAVHRANGETVYLHRAVMGLVKGDGLEVDHRDSNGLDCTKANLRVCSRAQNARHIRSHLDSQSQYAGVSWHRASGKWRATVGSTALGLFERELDAAKARDIAAAKAFGEFAIVNVGGVK
jgi:hypothetical protein